MTSANRVLRAAGLGMRFGGVHVFSDVSFAVAAGRVTGCIGPNGAGKSTLVNVICGVYRPIAGDVFLDERPIGGVPTAALVRQGVCRTFQDVRIFPTLTALENILVAFPDQRGESVPSLLLRLRPDETRRRAVAMTLLSDLSLADVADRPAGELAYGRQKLIALARAVATGARFLLLDEPAAGVEMELLPRVTGLVRRLAADGRGILLIEHNVDVIREVADDVFVLHGGGVIASGSCRAVLNDERVIRDYLGRIYNA